MTEMQINFCQRVHDIKIPSAKTKLVKNSIQYISNHCTEVLNLKTVASEMGVSREYLSKQFVKETGIHITDYIKQEKIIFAKKMLICTNASLVDISTALSFSSQCYFQNIFKQIEGCTPLEFRHAYRDLYK